MHCFQCAWVGGWLSYERKTHFLFKCNKDDFLWPASFYHFVFTGGRGAGRTTLNWEAHFGIVLGATCGIEHLHRQGPNISHGNIRSSNALLTKTYGYSCLGLWPSPPCGLSSTPNCVGGYRAPKMIDPCVVS